MAKRLVGNTALLAALLAMLLCAFSASSLPAFNEELTDQNRLQVDFSDEPSDDEPKLLVQYVSLSLYSLAASENVFSSAVFISRAPSGLSQIRAPPIKV